MAKITDVPDDDEDPLAAAMAAAQPRAARLKLTDAQPLRQPVHRTLSDDELLAKYDDEEDGRFEIPAGLEPTGMKYEWKTNTVLGKANVTGMSRYQRRGWQFVPAERHPGFWTGAGASGPIELEGSVLMEIEAEEYANLRRADLLRARLPVRGIYDRLSASPPGTGPRDAHPKIKPRVSRTFEPLPVES